MGWLSTLSVHHDHSLNHVAVIDTGKLCSYERLISYVFDSRVKDGITLENVDQVGTFFRLCFHTLLFHPL